MLSTDHARLQCENCSFLSGAILQAIRGAATDERLLGPASNLSLDCPNCNYILEHFAQVAPHSRFGAKCMLRLDIFPQKRFFIRPTCGCWDHAVYHLELLPSQQLAPETVHFTAIDPDRIKLGSLKRWTGYCDEHHTECRSSSSQVSVQDIILIDTQDHCLVQFPVAPRYNTLSYVWGVIPDILETRIANFADFQLPKALLRPEVLSRLPKTIRDAMKVTNELGERYLWVDRLCIVQDDEANKEQQIASMASIYENAYITIIAADGTDADSGLQGVSAPRSFSLPPTLNLASHCQMRSAPVTEMVNVFSEWHHRAWTFQERLLSRRCLIFFRGSVLWQCKTSIWAEGVAAEPDGIAPDDSWRKENRRSAYSAFDRRFGYQLEPGSRPVFYKFEDLVRGYSRLKLTYQADGLRAFTGILDVLSRTYDGGFLYGLPRMFFDAAMLWEPLPGAKPRLVAPESKTMLFPSWSWVAWEGRVANNLSYEISKRPRSLELHPLVKWLNVQSTGKTNLVNLTPHLFYQIRQHGVENVDFSFFDTPDIDMGNIGANKGDWDRLLHGNVMRAYFRLRPAKEVREENAAPVAEYLVTDASDQTVGWLKVHEPRYDKFVQHNALCECIVISSCKVYGDRAEDLKRYLLPEWGVIEEIRDLGEYDFYNVLWIEWSDGIAYRKGIGRVWKEGWHRQEVDTLDVILG